jgi:hypothetical protein
MNASEKRQFSDGDWATITSSKGKPPVTVQTFFVEHIETPTGRMRLVTDDARRVRAVDWEDYESRMHDLLRRYYGADSIQLREVSGRSAAALALLAYFDGDLNAIADLPTATNAPPSNTTSGPRSAEFRSGAPPAMARLRPRSDVPKLCAQLGSPTAPIPSPLLFRVIGLSGPMLR